MEKRYYVLKRIIGHFKLYKTFNKRTRLHMVILQDDYMKNKQKLINDIIYKIEELQHDGNRYSYNENFIYFEQDITKVTELFNATTNKDLLSAGLQKFWKKKPCFGILQVLGDKTYFALSGTLDYCGK